MHHQLLHWFPAPLLLPLPAVVIALSLCSRASAAEQIESVRPPDSNHKSGEQIWRFEPTKAKLRLQGTSNIDDWQVEASWIGGFLEANFRFPNLQAGQGPEVRARAEAHVEVSGLKSIEKDGKPFSNKMDEIMYAKLDAAAHPKITYRLTKISLKSAATDQDVPFLFETRGELVVAGVTNVINMPVNVMPLADNHLRISGSVFLRMTDFGITPPSPRITLGLIKTGNEVKLNFEWFVVQKNIGSISADR